MSAAASPSPPPSAVTSTVAAVGVGTLASYGDAPALLIGNGTNATNISAVSGDTHGIIIGGAVAGQGVYDNVNATAIQIGGSFNGVTSQPVNVVGGISISGSVVAAAYGNADPTIPTNFGNGSAIGLDIGAGATVPKIDVTGSVTATSLTNQTTNLPNVSAIQIEAGATGGIAITNNGVIAAAIGPTDVLSNNVVISQGGTAGTATAILDKAGAITSIVNTNTISASFSPANTTDTITGSAVAINLNANTVGVTITQNPGTVTTIVDSSGDNNADRRRPSPAT